MKAIRILGRVIAVLWAGFWILFVVASLVGYYWEGEPGPGPGPGESPLKSILITAGFVLAFLVAIFLAWRPPLVAGITYVLIAVLVTVGLYRQATSKMVLLMIGLPPLISGILFLLSSRRTRSPIT